MATDVDELVEYALVGALLRDPDQLNRMPWLTRDDFATFPAQQVYTELRRQHDLHTATGYSPAPTAESVADHLVGMTVPAIGHAGLHHMLTRTPPGADPIAYARIVLEESIRSAVRELGARVADTPGYDPQQVSLAAVTAVTAVAAVTQLQRRWELSEPPTAAPAPADAVPEPRLGAWLPDQRPQFEAIRAAERTVAAAANAVLDPAAVTAALHPDQLHEPGAALAVTAISVLLADRRPVDPVTVAWQQQRLRGDRDFTPLSWPELQAPTRAATADALSVLRADRAHELIYRAPDTLHRDAARHDQPLRQVLAAAAATLTDLSEAVTGHGLPRLGPAPTATASDGSPDAPGWGWLADRIDPRLRTGRDWRALAAALDRAYADGHAAAELPRLAARTPLPDRHPARDLQYRLLDDCPAAVTPVPIATRIALEHAPAAGTAPTRPPRIQPAPAPVPAPGPGAGPRR